MNIETIQFITIIGAILGSFVYIIKELRSFESEIRSDVKEQSRRTDKLYEMFIDLVKEAKK